jgi:hypothetical protein
MASHYALRASGANREQKIVGARLCLETSLFDIVDAFLCVNPVSPARRCTVITVDREQPNASAI